MTGEFDSKESAIAILKNTRIPARYPGYAEWVTKVANEHEFDYYKYKK